jgi:hypothetical protein
MSVHHLPPRGAKGLCVLASDGVSVGRVVFDDADTGCQHSADGDLVITRASRGGRRRVTASFPAGTWVLAARVLGEEDDGRLQLEDIEWPRQQRTGDAAAVDAAVAADHAWFATSPSATGYIRRALPGEWSANRVGEPPIPGAVLLVEVRRVAPGLNSRQPAWALRLQARAQSSPHPRPAQENE